VALTVAVELTALPVAGGGTDNVTQASTRQQRLTAEDNKSESSLFSLAFLGKVESHNPWSVNLRGNFYC
jgi:hypothetical protein